MKSQYKERFLRNFGIMDDSSQMKIKSTCIAIGGLGLGGSIFLNLVRMGFERFHVADPDVYERTNSNRQRMAKESTVDVRKDDALIREARDINPDIEIRAFRDGVNPSNVSEFLTGVDWVVDVVDVFAMPEKLALNAEAAKRGLPVVSCGSLGFSASVVVFEPGGPTFAELTGMSPELDYQTNVKRFLRFICPVIPDYMKDQMALALERKSHIPFVVTGVETTAAFAASEVAKRILGLGARVVAPFGISVDPLSLEIVRFEADYKARELDLVAHMPTRKAA